LPPEDDRKREKKRDTKTAAELRQMRAHLEAIEGALRQLLGGDDTIGLTAKGRALAEEVTGAGYSRVQRDFMDDQDSAPHHVNCRSVLPSGLVRDAERILFSSLGIEWDGRP
jgi:hypothetical protein